MINAHKYRAVKVTKSLEDWLKDVCEFDPFPIG